MILRAGVTVAVGLACALSACSKRDGAGSASEAPKGEDPRSDEDRGMATVYGQVVWAVTEYPEGWDGDRVGDLVLGVFAQDPSKGIFSFPVAAVLERDVDLRAGALPFRLSGIPPREEPYYLTAFLDDDQNAGPVPFPDRFDAVSVVEIAGEVKTPTVAIVRPGEQEQLIRVNAIIP